MINKSRKDAGMFAGVPYDWRNPTEARLLSRLWNPKAPLVTKKWYGWGYDLNLYAIVHPVKWRRSRSQAKK